MHAQPTPLIELTGVGEQRLRITRGRVVEDDNLVGADVDGGEGPPEAALERRALEAAQPVQPGEACADEAVPVPRPVAAVVEGRAENGLGDEADRPPLHLPPPPRLVAILPQ